MKKEDLRYPSNIERYNPDCKFGLSEEQVKGRQQANLLNINTLVTTKSIARILLGNICTLFNLLNFALALAVLLVGSYKNLLFIGVIICNTFIGTFQEIRAKKSVDKLSLISSTKAKVIRAGKKK